MLAYAEIRDVHLEISTLCNASCPWCPRNFWGYPYNGGYPELYLSISDVKKIFIKDFLLQLMSIRVNGNYGDIVMNPDSAEIVEYFKEINPDLDLSISTNGGARDEVFWQRLARAKARVIFCLDGLADTHHLYRQNTVWSIVIKNARTFIESGGHAEWKMIRFRHNQHQIDQCRIMSKDMGFQAFQLVDDGRDSAPVFDRHGNLVHVMGDYRGETDFKVLFHRKKTDDVLLKDIMIGREPKKHIDCATKRLKSIYIAANGDVSPCCFMGFYPATYGRGQYHQAANTQLVSLIRNNNALERPLSECIKWFEAVERSWKIPNYARGRLVICDDNCGSH